MNNLIYTDSCNNSNKTKIKTELGMDVISGIDPKLWNLSDALSIIMTPSIELAVFNVISEITVIEMALLNFMGKPILVTARRVDLDYPILATKIIDYINFLCDLRNEDSIFINWYKGWKA
jgi:hypothetical protein